MHRRGRALPDPPDSACWLWLGDWVTEVWSMVQGQSKVQAGARRLGFVPSSLSGDHLVARPWPKQSRTRPRGQHTSLITMLSQVPEIYPLPAAHLLLLMFSLHSNRLQHRVFGCCPKWMVSVALVFFKVWLKLWNRIDFLHLVLPIRSH